MPAAGSLSSSWTLVLLYTTVLWTVWLPRSHGLDISYCSPENNAANYPGQYNQYQSNGACQVQCQGSFAFAVIQGHYCWCSNYVPTNQESTLNCNQQCPGFGSEWCGSTDADLYAYFLLSQGVPLGTTGAPSSATSSPSVSTPTSRADPGSVSPTSDAADTTSSPSSPVVTDGSSQSSDEASSVSFPSDASTISLSSTTRSTSSRSTTSATSSSTSSPTPTEIYTSVTTVTGEVRTVVVTPSATSDATLGQGATDGGGGGVSTGKVVGIVLGVALGLGAIIGIALWFWFRRRHQKLAAQKSPEPTFISRTGDTSPSNNIPSRQVSQLSSSGLLGSSKAPRINTSGLGLGPDSRSAETASPGFDRRSLGTDQRLNPYALYIHDESRLSNVSLQDNQDYSRQLRVANPDA